MAVVSVTALIRTTLFPLHGIFPPKCVSLSAPVAFAADKTKQSGLLYQRWMFGRERRDFTWVNFPPSHLELLLPRLHLLFIPLRSCVVNLSLRGMQYALPPASVFNCQGSSSSCCCLLPISPRVYFHFQLLVDEKTHSVVNLAGEDGGGNSTNR